MSENLLKFSNPDLWLPGKGHFEAIYRLPFIHDESTGVDYFLKVEGDTLFCVFQATSQRKDWFYNFLFFPKRKGRINRLLFPQKYETLSGSNIRVHMGIAIQYLSMRKQFLDLAFDDGIKNILIAGFSLGGGLAQLACHDAAWHLSGKGKVIKSISYAGPRVFHRNRSVRRLIEDKQVLVKTFWDPVVHVPFRIMGFRDYGKKDWIGRWNRIRPMQHEPEQIRRNLYEKHGR